MPKADLSSPELQTRLKQKRGLPAFREALLPSPLHPGFGAIGTDLDDTTKEAIKIAWSDGKKRRVYPETVAAFKALFDAGISVTPITEQAVSEILPWTTDVAQLALGRPDAQATDLFTGIIVEGGCVAVRGRGHKKGETVVLAKPHEVQHSRAVLIWLREHINLADDPELRKEGWGVLDGVDPEKGTYVMLPPDDEQGMVSVSLWKKGPLISADPSYIPRYSAVDARIQQALQEELGIHDLIAREAGNGTGRIMSRHIDKARTLMRLAGFGAFTPSRIGYFCDGPNDVDFAQELKAQDGYVIAVANAVPRLHEISDYSATLPAGRGFAEAVAQLFPDQYNSAMADLQNLGLGLAQ